MYILYAHTGEYPHRFQCGYRVYRLRGPLSIKLICIHICLEMYILCTHTETFSVLIELYTQRPQMGCVGR